MTWTYSGDPSNSDLDNVRFFIQDTDTDDQLLQDEEIQFLIDENGVSVAAWKAAETIASKFSRFTDRSLGDFSESASQRVQQYNKIAKELRKRATIKAARPYAGGISISDKESVGLDSDRVEPTFRRDTHENQKKSISGVDNDEDE